MMVAGGDQAVTQLPLLVVVDERQARHRLAATLDRLVLHESRPHQSKDNNLLVPAADAKKAEEPDVVSISDIRGKKRLGGVLKHDYRKAA